MFGYSCSDNPLREPYEETSTKKYPYNKYHDFKDEESSGRKYIREELNFKENSPYFLNIDPNDDTRMNTRKNQNKLNLKKKKQTNSKKIHNKSVGSQRYPKNQSCNQSIHSISNRNKQNNSNSIKWSKVEDNLDELKHYKKLCLDMRKKNCDLEKELHECKEENKKSILELNYRVQRMNQKYQEKKEGADECKVQKILASLKTIKSKLRKQPHEPNHTKFYKFFMESAGILFADGLSEKKMTYLQMQVLWKQILQFLIAHDFKPEGFNHKTSKIR